MAMSTVFILFLAGSPFYVVRFISKVIIDALNGVFGGWPFANMIIKSHKIIFPFRTNGNATSSIIFKVFIGWIAASAFYGSPCFVFRGLRHPMRGDPIFNKLGRKAAATFGMTETREPLLTETTLLQVHLQSHLTLLALEFLARFITVSLWNVFPVRSINLGITKTSKLRLQAF